MIGKVGIGIWAVWGFATAIQIDWNGAEIVKPGKVIELNTEAGHVTRHVDSAEFFADPITGNRYHNSTTTLVEMPKGGNIVCKQDFWRANNRNVVLPFISYDRSQTDIYKGDVYLPKCKSISSDDTARLKVSFETPKQIKTEQLDGALSIGSHLKLSIAG